VRWHVIPTASMTPETTLLLNLVCDSGRRSSPHNEISHHLPTCITLFAPPATQGERCRRLLERFRTPGGRCPHRDAACPKWESVRPKWGEA
jgi:hypothetical protein